METPILIYCAGKNSVFDAIALEAGFKLGIQLPNKVDKPILFADQNWKTPNRSGYMAMLAEHKPEIATVLDWERRDQLPEVMNWADEISQYVKHIVIIPKVIGGIERLPRTIGKSDIWLGYSVPTKFGGTPVPAWEFKGWPVHLLGGSPHKQMMIADYLDVQSADGNMSNRMAQMCRYWRKERGDKGHWWKLGDWPNNANQEAFRRSCHNIVQAWIGRVGNEEKAHGSKVEIGTVQRLQAS